MFHTDEKEKCINQERKEVLEFKIKSKELKVAKKKRKEHNKIN